MTKNHGKNELKPSIFIDMNEKPDIETLAVRYILSIMIVSASYRTDIPAFYGGWFAQALALYVPARFLMLATACSGAMTDGSRARG